MASRFALPDALTGLRSRINIPDAVPPFSNRVYNLFWVIWAAAFILAIAGPATGIYFRYAAPENNSFLLPGSRAGIAVSDQDATKIRFPVGPESRALGIVPGDDIVAIFGLPVPDVMPVTPIELEERPADIVYINFRDLLYGTEDFEAQLTLRSPEGRERDVVIQTGEKHLEAATRELGLRPRILSFVDLLHVITYPFLLWASWILHRRNARDAVSSILSLAILLTMGTEAPSATFMAQAGVPRWLHVLLYDIGNICLLAGILLFPHGKLSGRLVLILAILPVLLFLHGDVYRAVFILFIICAVLMLVRCLRRTPPGDLRQQIKWALYGFSSYAFFIAISLTADMLKMFVGAFSQQLIIEMLAGFAVGIAYLSLQLGLLVALLRFRLYDAEAIISRSASIAIVTLVLGALFAGIMEGIITQMQDTYSDSQTPAAMVGAVMATVLIHPLHTRVQGWIERRFHKNLLDLREGLPEVMRDLREVADVPEFLTEVLGRVNKGVYATRSAVVIDHEVNVSTGIPQDETMAWFATFPPTEQEKPLQCDPDDPVFPIRLRLAGAGHGVPGWLLIGPRPDGSLTGGDERSALIDIADPLSRALRIVIEREKDKQEIVTVLAEFRSRIELLEKRLPV